MSRSFELSPGMEPFPGYILHLPIGRGGCGEVWEARSQGRAIALKFMQCKNSTAAAKEVKSAEAIRLLDHPNLLHVEKVFLQSGYVVIAMELADGSLMDLFDLYVKERGTAIDTPRVCNYLSQVAAALDFLSSPEHLHENKTVFFQHCDVKPNNLLLVGETVKLADYGLATPMSVTLEPHGRCGTLEFAAPEVFRGQVSNRTDQFALAVSYCLLRGGRLPFPNSPSRFTPSYSRSHPDLRMLSEAERPIVARGLSVSPVHRWPTCSEMMARLSELVDEVAWPESGEHMVPHEGSSHR